VREKGANNALLFAMYYLHLHCIIIACFNLFLYVCLPAWWIKIILVLRIKRNQKLVIYHEFTMEIHRGP